MRIPLFKNIIHNRLIFKSPGERDWESWERAPRLDCHVELLFETCSFMYTLNCLKRISIAIIICNLSFFISSTTCYDPIVTDKTSWPRSTGFFYRPKGSYVVWITRLRNLSEVFRFIRCIDRAVETVTGPKYLCCGKERIEQSTSLDENLTDVWDKRVPRARNPVAKKDTGMPLTNVTDLSLIAHRVRWRGELVFNTRVELEF